MYRFIKVNIKEMHTDVPDGVIEDILVLSEDVGSKAGEQTYYFTLDKRFFRTDAGFYHLPPHLVASLPYYIEDARYLYLALAKYGEKKAILIEPNLYENKKEEEVCELIDLEFKEGSFAHMTDFIDDYYMTQHIFFEEAEVTETGRRRYFTLDEVHEAEEETEFTNFYKVHEEPLLYRIGEDDLLMVTEEDIEDEKIRVLHYNDEEGLMESHYIYQSELINTLKEGNYTLRHFLEADDALRQIKRMQEITL